MHTCAVCVQDERPDKFATTWRTKGMLPVPVWPEQGPLLHHASSTKPEALVGGTTAALPPATLPIANSLSRGSTKSLFHRHMVFICLISCRVKITSCVWSHCGFFNLRNKLFCHFSGSLKISKIFLLLHTLRWKLEVQDIWHFP